MFLPEVEQTPPKGAHEKAMFAFLERMDRESSTLQQEEIEAVVAAGWPEEAVYDAITVCALFNFYNKWIDATGVSDMPAEAYVATGERRPDEASHSPQQSISTPGPNQPTGGWRNR